MLLKKSEVKHPNFIDKDQLFLVRCPKCKKENYMLAVASGRCAWCGEQFEIIGDINENN